MNLIYNNWAKAGGVISILIIAYSFINFQFFSINFIAWLSLALLMLHQFEEYVLPGGFKNFFNANISKANRFIRFKINDTAAFNVNVTLGWTAYLIAALLAENYLFLLIVILVITFINGIVHTAALIILKKYNPGFITGLFLFIPFSAYSVVKLEIDRTITGSNWVIIITAALTGSLLIPLILYLTKKYENN